MSSPLPEVPQVNKALADIHEYSPRCLFQRRWRQAMDNPVQVSARRMRVLSCEFWKARRLSAPQQIREKPAGADCLPSRRALHATTDGGGKPEQTSWLKIGPLHREQSESQCGSVLQRYEGTRSSPHPLWWIDPGGRNENQRQRQNRLRLGADEP